MENDTLKGFDAKNDKNETIIIIYDTAKFTKDGIEKVDGLQGYAITNNSCTLESIKGFHDSAKVRKIIADRGYYTIKAKLD